MRAFFKTSSAKHVCLQGLRDIPGNPAKAKEQRDALNAAIYSLAPKQKAGGHLEHPPASVFALCGCLGSLHL